MELIGALDAAEVFDIDTDHYGLSGANYAAYMAQFLGLLTNNGEMIAAEFCDPIVTRTNAPYNIFFP